MYENVSSVIHLEIQYGRQNAAQKICDHVFLEPSDHDDSKNI